MNKRFSTLLAGCLLAAQAFYVQANTLPAKGATGPKSHTAPPPVITQVVGGSNNGTYILGRTITIYVLFLDPVNVAGGRPQLNLETGTTDRTANYTGGSGSSTLAFEYTVQDGDQSADLDYLSTTAISLNGATITDAGDQSNANLTLPAPGAPGSLGYSRNYAIDGSVPQVSSVYVPSDATYGGPSGTCTSTSFSMRQSTSTRPAAPQDWPSTLAAIPAMPTI